MNWARVEPIGVDVLVRVTIGDALGARKAQGLAGLDRADPTELPAARDSLDRRIGGPEQGLAWAERQFPKAAQHEVVRVVAVRNDVLRGGVVAVQVRGGLHELRERISHADHDALGQPPVQLHLQGIVIGTAEGQRRGGDSRELGERLKAAGRWSWNG